MQAKEETLAVIREIAADGVVTDDEVIQLAVFMNDNLEARTSWPGIAIYEVLREVLDDGKVDDFERQALIHVLSGIDVICAGATAALEGDTVVTKKPVDEVHYELSDFQLPELEIDAVRERLEDPHAVMHLVHHECRCENWNKARGEFAERSPGRGCSCIVENLLALAKANPQVMADWPSQMRGLIKRASAGGRGFDPVGTWKLLKIDGIEAVIAKGKTEWCSVFVPAEKGQLEKYSYHLGNDRWGYGASPDCAKAIEPVFRAGLRRILEAELED